MKIFSQYRGLRKENYVLFFGRIVTSMGAMIWPMMTMILSRKMGMSAGMISVLMALATVGMFPANVIGGKIADRFEKKMNIVYCDIISVVSYLVCGFIPLSMVSLVLMFAAAFCQTMEQPSYSALIADLTETKDRDRAFSLSYLGGNLGLVLSPTIAGLLFENHLGAAFCISGLSIGCSTLLIFFLIGRVIPVKEETEEASYQADRGREGLFTVMKENPAVMLFIVTMGLYYGVYMHFNFLMPLELSAIHGSSGPLIFGTITSVNCIVVVVLTPFLTRMTRGMHDPAKTIAGLLLIMAGFLIFVLTRGMIPAYYLAMFTFTCGEIFSVLADNPYLTRRVPSSHRGRFVGMSAVVQLVFSGASQLIIGQVYDRVGGNAAWACVFLFGGLGLLSALLLMKKDREVYPKLYGPRAGVPE